MRSINTFVLHLVVDSSTPTRMCGDVRALNGAQSHAFKDSSELIELLRRLIRDPAGPTLPESEAPDADVISETARGDK